MSMDLNDMHDWEYTCGVRKIKGYSKPQEHSVFFYMANTEDMSPVWCLVK